MDTPWSFSHVSGGSRWVYSRQAGPWLLEAEGPYKGSSRRTGTWEYRVSVMEDRGQIRVMDSGGAPDLVRAKMNAERSADNYAFSTDVV